MTTPKKIVYYSHVVPGHDPARGPFTPKDKQKPKTRGKRGKR